MKTKSILFIPARDAEGQEYELCKRFKYGVWSLIHKWQDWIKSGN